MASNIGIVYCLFRRKRYPAPTARMKEIKKGIVVSVKLIVDAAAFGIKNRNQTSVIVAITVFVPTKSDFFFSVWDVINEIEIKTAMLEYASGNPTIPMLITIEKPIAIAEAIPRISKVMIFLRDILDLILVSFYTCPGSASGQGSATNL